MIDFDPERPSGTSSTDEEKAAALACAQQVATWLKESGWPDPIWVDSGNGYHLLFRGDLCNPDSKASGYLLKTMGQMFSTAQVKVDLSVADPAQLGRVPGTWNAKGPNTPERPHRRCRVMSYPEKWLPVEHGPMIYRLANKHGFDVIDRKKAHKPVDVPALVDDIDDRIYEFQEEFPEFISIENVRDKGEEVYYDLAFCPFTGHKHKGDRGKTSIIVGPDYVGFKCFSDDCEGLGMQDLRVHLRAQTGEWPETRFYEEDEDREERLYAKWGLDLDEDDEDEEDEDEDEELGEDKDGDDASAYHEFTGRVIASGELSTINPDDYGLTVDDLREPFSAWLMLWVTAGKGSRSLYEIEFYGDCILRDAKTMALIMGPNNLYAVYRDRNLTRGSQPTPPSPIPAPTLSPKVQGDPDFDRRYLMPVVDQECLAFLRLCGNWAKLGVKHTPIESPTSPYRCPPWMHVDQVDDDSLPPLPPNPRIRTDYDDDFAIDY